SGARERAADIWLPEVASKLQSHRGWPQGADRPAVEGLVLSQPEPRRRPATPREILQAAGVVLLMLGGYVVAELYSRWAGALLCAHSAEGLLVEAARMPRQQRARLVAVIDRQGQTPWGRLARIVELGGLVLLAAAALKWLFERL